MRIIKFRGKSIDGKEWLYGDLVIKNRVEKYLNFFSFSEHERRLDQLEDALGLKEYFDEEPLDEEDNE